MGRVIRGVNGYKIAYKYSGLDHVPDDTLINIGLCGVPTLEYVMIITAP